MATSITKPKQKYFPVIIPPRIIKKRWAKKKAHLHQIANSMRSLRYNLTRDLNATASTEADQAQVEKKFLTALVISVMLQTSERVGNDDSARNGHFGVTGFRKKHIRVNGNQVTFRYTGKSGVKHEKVITDSSLGEALKKAIKNSPNRFIFCTSDGFRIRADRVNRYLQDYKITAKDIRGFCANSYIILRLKKEEPILGVENENKRKRVFNKALKCAAQKVGHGSATLRKHYVMPELSDYYVQKGEIIDLTNFYAKGGEVNGYKFTINEMKKGGQIFERGASENPEYGLTVSSGEAGVGVYAYIPSSSMRNYYTKNGETLVKFTLAPGSEIVDLTKESDKVLEFIRSSFYKTKEKMVHFIEPKVNKDNFQRFGNQIMQYVQKNYPNASAYIVPHKGPGIPNGKQVIITKPENIEIIYPKFFKGGRIALKSQNKKRPLKRWVGAKIKAVNKP